MEELKKSLSPFSIDFSVSNYGPNQGKICLLSDTDDGDWPTTIGDEDGDDDFIEFSFEQFVCPHLCDGEVLIVQTIGNEKLRYLSGFSTAYTKDGKIASVDINDIYGLVVDKLGFELGSVTRCEY